MIDCSKCPNPADCCGIFGLDASLVEKHKDKFQVKPKEIMTIVKGKQYVVTDDILCVFLNRKTKRCAIYEDRPEVCRLFGVSKDKKLQCPYFKPSGNRRSPASEKQAHKYINKMFEQAKKEVENE